MNPLKALMSARAPEQVPGEPLVDSEPFDYESIPVGYYDAVFRRGSGMQSKWHHLKFRRVARELEGYRSVLDVGCGPGTMVGHLASRHESIGTDLSTRQIAYAQRTYGSPAARFYAASPAGLPPEEGPFDAVALVELIEHLDPVVVEATIDEALERLRPGGKLVLTTPNFRSAWPLIEAVINRVSDVTYDFQHINKFTPKRLVGLLESHGLTDVHVEPYLFMAPFAAALGWRLADGVARLESGPVERRLGMLLLGTGIKPG